MAQTKKIKGGEKLYSRNLFVGIIATVFAAALFFGAAALYNFLAEREEQRLSDLRESLLETLADREGEYDAQSIVVSGLGRREIEKMAAKYGASVRNSRGGSFAVLTLPDGISITDVVADEENVSNIDKLSADFYVSLLEERAPTNPQYSVKDDGFESQDYLSYLNLAGSWTLTRGANAVVAIIDSGIDVDHPEFAGRISEYSYNATTDTVIKDTLLPSGEYDWSIIDDKHGHGTSVAGVVGAAIDGSGTVGIAPEATILVIKAETTARGQFSASDLIFGMEYLAEVELDGNTSEKYSDVSVVNMSFGSYYHSSAEESAIENMIARGIACVASAGNDGTTRAHFPSSFEGVISIGALAENSWQLADYSNYGVDIDAVAPGTTYTTALGGGYATVTGTSLASPVVAGAIALYRAENTSATVGDVIERLHLTSYDLGSGGKDLLYGYGALDIGLLISGKQESVTFDMMTGELENVELKFIAGSKVQEPPEPERLYSVFDGWYYDIHYKTPVDFANDEFASSLTVYAKWGEEKAKIPFTYEITDDGTVRLLSYTGRSRLVTVPSEVGGRAVTEIGPRLFEKPQNIKSVTIPEGIKTIAKNAFVNCVSLEQIYIPASVTVIGDSAFLGASSLEKIIFAEGSGITDIGSNALNGTAITEIDLPASLKNLGAKAFLACKDLKSINVSSDNVSFSSKDGVLFNKTGSTLIAFPTARVGEYTLPDGVSSVGSGAFSGSALSSIDLNSATRIENEAFSYSSLLSVSIPSSVIHIGESAFEYSSLLTEVTVEARLNSIPKQCFYGCNSLESVNIPDSVESIGTYAFAGTSSLRDTIISESSSLISIDKGAFSYSGITSVSLPATLNKISDNAFLGCTSLSSVSFAEGCTLQSIGELAFDSTSRLEAIELPCHLRVIGASAFSSSGIREIILPASLESIGNGAFSSCTSLENIFVDEANPTFTHINGVLHSKDKTVILAYPVGRSDTLYRISEGVHTVGDGAFRAAIRLNRVIFPRSLRSIGDNAFSGCYSISSYSFGAELKSIGNSAFYANDALRTVSIPSSVERIGASAFSSCLNLSAVTFEPESSLRILEERSFSGTAITSFRIPASVTDIESDVFADCRKLTTVTFEDNSGIVTLPSNVFSKSTSITSIVFEENSALKYLADNAFDGLVSLKSISFENTRLEYIGSRAFRFCNSLEDIALPSTVEYIGDYVFYYCFSLDELYIPASLTDLGAYCFIETKDINLYFESETLPSRLAEDWDRGVAGYHLGTVSTVELGDWYIARLTSNRVAIVKYNGSETEIDLNAVDFGGDVITISGKVFIYSSAEKIILPDTLITIQSEAFYGSMLTEVSIPATVEHIGREAFANTPIETLVFEGKSSLTKIEQSAFENTKSLKSLTLPASVEIIERAAFKSSGITSLTFEDGIGLTEISPEVFAYTPIRSLSLPEKVVKLCEGAFRETKALERVSFGSEYLYIADNAFYRSGLTELNIPASVEYIGEFAFAALSRLGQFTVDEANPYYCSYDGMLFDKDMHALIAAPAARMGSISIPAEVEIIYGAAFEESSLSFVDISNADNLLVIGARAFTNAKNLKEFTVPESALSVGYYSFAYASSLENVSFFSEGIKEIREGAFYGCRSLSDIILPSTVVEIGDYAFYDCEALKMLPVNAPCSLGIIGKYAFAYSGISELSLPKSVTDVFEYAFLGAKIKTLHIPRQSYEYLKIYDSAFEDCEELYEVTMPFIGSSADSYGEDRMGFIFGSDYPDSLETVTITEKLEFIPAEAFSNLTALKHIAIPEGYTRIGNKAFYNCHSLLEIIIPDGVTTVDYQAFYNCSSAKTVVIPDSVTAVGSSAFYNCEGIEYLYIGDCVSSMSNINVPSGCKELVIGEGITTIGQFRCSALKSLTIGSNVTSFSYFECPSLKNVYISDLNAWLNMKVKSGLPPMTYAKNLYLNGELIENLVIPEGITEINDSAFRNCAHIKSITIPDTVHTIGDNAFAYCDITEITIPASVSSIGNCAFSSCENLQKVKILGDNVTIGYNAFARCKKLAELELGGTVSLGRESFYMCESLTVLELGEGLITIGEAAFADCTALESLVIPDSVTDIGMRAFDGCLSLSSITVGCGINTVGASAFNFGNIEHAVLDSLVPLEVTSFSDKLVSAVIGDNVSILSGTFKNCTRLERVALGKAVSVIGESSFEGCSALAEIVIPSGVTEIGASAFAGCTALAEIIIPSGVTEIGASAFAGCTALEKITLPSTITVINPRTFEGCTALAEITIPDEVTGIGEYAFEGCSALCAVVFPAGLSEIADRAFYACESITALHFPTSLTSIGSNAFYGCKSITALTIPDGVVSVSQDAFSECSSLEEITVGNGVSDLGAFNFSSYEKLKSVKLGNGITAIGETFRGCATIESIALSVSVTEISDYAFYGCNALKELVIPDGVTSIGSYAFGYCTSLTDIVLPDSVTDIKSLAFYNCTSLESIDFGDGISVLDASGLLYCQSLTEVTLGKGLKEITWQSSRSYPVHLTVINITDVAAWCSVAGLQYIKADKLYLNGELVTELVIPEGVTNINSYAFSGFTHISEVSLPQSLLTVGGSAFEGCTAITRISGGESVTEICDSAFEGCSSLFEMTLSPSLTYIGNAAFSDCVSLTEVAIPASLTDVGARAFSGCSGLLGVTFAEGLLTISAEAFKNCFNITVLILPDTLTDIGADAFYGCEGILEVTLGKSLTSVSSAAFAACDRITVVYNNSATPLLPESSDFGYVARYAEMVVNSDGSKAYKSENSDFLLIKTEDGLIFRYLDGAYALIGYSGTEQSVTLPLTVNGEEYSIYKALGFVYVTIPEGFTEISRFAFYGSDTLRGVSLPSSLTVIDNRAFWGCSSLESIEIGASIERIGSYAFTACRALREVKFNEGVSEIGENAFTQCDSLTEVTLPGSLTEISADLFLECTSLKRVVISSGTLTVNDAFDLCYKLEYVYIPDTVEEFNSGFYLCNALKDIVLGEKNKSFSSLDGVIYNKEMTEIIFVSDGATKVTLPESITYIGYQFEGKANLREIIIHDEVRGIQTNAFSGCTSLERVVIGENSKLTYLGAFAFNDCSSLTSIYIPKGITSIGSCTFSGCSSLETVTVDADITSIGNNAFAGCSALKSIELPTSLTSLGSRAFFGCASLESIYLPECISTISSYCFYGCTALDYVWLPSELTEIGESAFQNTTIRGIIIPDGVTSIGSSAFSNCSELSSLVIPDSVTYIGVSAFVNTSLETLVIGDGITDLSFLKSNSSFYTSSLCLKEVVFGDGITSIPNNAFRYCSSIERITFGNNVTGIGANAFYGCGELEAINIPSIDLWLSFEFENFDACLKGPLYIDGELVTSVKIPESVTSIGSYTFYNNTGITEIHLHPGVTSIGDYAFSGCESLETVELGTGLSLIGASAFSRCTALTIIELPDSIISLGASAFFGCEGLERVILSDGLTNIGESTFYACTSLREIIFSDGIASIGSQAFRDCTSLMSIELPTSLETIAYYAFNGCTSLSEVSVPKSLSTVEYGTFGDCAITRVNIEDLDAWCGIIFGDNRATPLNGGALYLNGTPVTELSISDAVERIESYAFLGCTSLERIIIPDSVTYIGSSAFADCVSVIYLEIGDGVSSLGGFGGYPSLETIIIGNGVTSVSQSLFSDSRSSLKYISLGDGITEISKYLFENCTALERIEFGNNLLRIGAYAFHNCTSLKRIEIDAVDEIAATAFISMELEELVLGDGVGVIAERAFYGASIDRLTISSIEGWLSVSGNGCFELMYRCGEMYLNGAPLTEVIIPEGTTAIRPYAFYGVTTIEKIVLPEGLISIGHDAFMGASVVSITLPSTLEEIGNSAFSGCTALDKVYNNSHNLTVLPASYDNGGVAYYARLVVDAEGKGYYRGVNGDYTDILTPDGFRFVYKDGVYTLRCYVGDKSTVTLPLDINGESYLIDGFFGAEHIIFPEGMTEICANAFYESNEIVSITIPSSVTTVGEYAFANCKSLVAVNGGDGIVNMGWAVFGGTPFYENPEKWDNGVFYFGNFILEVNSECKILNLTGYALADRALYYATGVEILTVGDIASGEIQAGRMLSLKILIIDELQVTSISQYFKYRDTNNRVYTEVPETLEKVVLCEGVRMCDYLFSGLSDIEIFVEAEEKDIKWDENFRNWRNENDVEYSHGENWIKAYFYDYDGKFISGDVYTVSQVIRIPHYDLPVSNDYVYTLIGWDINGDGTPDTVPATSTVDIEAHCVLSESEREYRVEFIDKDGKTVLYTYLLTYGSAMPTPESPTKQGYSFIGWLDYEASLTVTQDIKIYSEWKHDGDGHVYGVPVWIAPSCTKQGYDKHICTICGEWYATNVTPPTGHSFIDTEYPASCTSGGFTLHSCTCGHSYKSDETEPLGHDFGELTVLNESGCVTDGEGYRVCKRCSYEQAESIAPHGHEYLSELTRKPSCTEVGEVSFVCRYCGDTDTEAVEKLPHSYEKKTASKHWIQWLIELLLNIFYGYEGENAYYYECEDCGYIRRADDQMHGVGVESICEHKPTDWVRVADSICTEQPDLWVRSCESCKEIIDTSVRGTITLGHDIISHTAKAPTCTEIGWNAYETCSRCDYTTYSEIPMSEHSFSEWTEALAPTCESDGEKERVCEHCGHTETDILSALGHDLISHGAKAPTCTEAGYKAYDTCTRCDYTTYRSVAATGHSFGGWKTLVYPTCTESGEKERVCTKCPFSETESISALGHEIIAVRANAPTCTSVGWNAYEYCLNCDYTTYVAISATGHSFTEWMEFFPADCESAGEDIRYCYTCGYEERKVTEPLGHDLVHHLAQEPSCTDYGWTTYDTCTRCEYDTYKAIAPLGHSFGEWRETISPTCESDGLSQRDCERCSHYEIAAISSLGHDKVHVAAKAPTCTEIGHGAYDYCTRCDYTTYEQIAALGHSLTYHEAKAPSCTDHGWDAYEKCSRCDYTTYNEISATGHLYESVTYAPTCTEGGYTLHTCHCGHSYIDSHTNVTEHSFGSWHIISPGDCVINGFKARECSSCGYSQTEEIVAPGHTLGDWNEGFPATCQSLGQHGHYYCSTCHGYFDRELREIFDIIIYEAPHDYTSVITEPTCTEMGYTTHTCVCGDSYLSDYTTAKGHSFGEWVLGIAPTCTASGENVRVCLTCKISETSELLPLGHTITVHEGKLPTCTEIGWNAYESCSACDYNTYTEIPMSEHSFGNWQQHISPDCTEQGEERRYCQSCEHYESRITEASGHNYTAASVTAPTCTEMGYTTHTCRCGESFVDSYTDALGHTEGEWIIDWNATTTSQGQRHKECTVCQTTLVTEVIDCIPDTNTRDFDERMNAVRAADSNEELFYQLCEAVRVYNSYNDVQKKLVADEYAELCGIIESYNSTVEYCNEEHDEAVTVAIGVVLLSLGWLSLACLVIFKKYV